MVREAQCNPFCSLDSCLLMLLGLISGRQAEDLCYSSETKYEKLHQRKLVHYFISASWCAPSSRAAHGLGQAWLTKAGFFLIKIIWRLVILFWKDSHIRDALHMVCGHQDSSRIAFLLGPALRKVFWKEENAGRTSLHTQILAALLPLGATSWHKEPEELLNNPWDPRRGQCKADIQCHACHPASSPSPTLTRSATFPLGNKWFVHLG